MWSRLPVWVRIPEGMQNTKIKLMRATGVLGFAVLATGASAFAQSNSNFGQNRNSHHNYRPQQNYSQNYQQNSPCGNQNSWDNRDRRGRDDRDDRNGRDQNITLRDAEVVRVTRDSVYVSSNDNGRRGGTTEVKVSRNTRITDCNGREQDLRDLREGDKINVRGECLRGDCDVIEATVIAESCDNNRR
jgi:hypothetical protein